MMSTGEACLQTTGPGIFRWQGAPRYGRQDLGFTPGGAQDRFALASGNAILDNPPLHSALEIVHPPPAVRFTKECLFVLTGGALQAELHHGDGPESPPVAVEHAVAYLAPAGSELFLYGRLYGWRTYLCVRAVPDPEAVRRVEGRRRGSFQDVARWPDRDGRIRVLEGPEYRALDDPDEFFSIPWRTGNDMSDVGMRLEGSPALKTNDEQLISGPVCDGTIQLTPAGPIILLRDRQTVGGYPRIFVVISADVDLLAQYGPGHRVRFVKVDIAEARRAAAVWQQDLTRLTDRVSAS